MLLPSWRPRGPVEPVAPMPVAPPIDSKVPEALSTATFGVG